MKNTRNNTAIKCNILSKKDEEFLFNLYLKFTIPMICVLYNLFIPEKCSRCIRGINILNFFFAEKKRVELMRKSQKLKQVILSLPVILIRSEVLNLKLSNYSHLKLISFQVPN
ncbi:hypothetical protein BpHYR1_005298 [Brachionus plicatilis]|uniref:Uncharacterized protein n=1 Tax=Brachionus plicatilis TaxID=10195 RepID=A0A3M7S5N8_BRAPC|nr:hypothetical protein BpHYR1_005298 [Brachionus plicatilis]